MPDILLSGFADESAPDKTIDQQFSAMAALGLQYLSIRFIDVGGGIKNVLDLTPDEFDKVRLRLDHFGLKIASIGSPVGKVKLLDIDDGTDNRFVPFDEYLKTEVQAAINAASQLSTRLIRGFSFSHPRDTDASACMNQAVDQIAQIVEACDAADLTFGLEVEANLIGSTGSVLGEIHRQINHPALVLIFDGGNLVSQGYDAPQILAQFQEMVPGLGWMHVKDYLKSKNGSEVPGGYIDEEKLDQFVPADKGSSGHDGIFAELAGHLPEIKQRLAARSIPGFFVDLEPHLRGGGQFGGYSGPDGMGIALQGLRNVLGVAGISYHLKTLEDLQVEK